MTNASNLVIYRQLWPSAKKHEKYQINHSGINYTGDLMAMGWHKLAVIFSNHKTNFCALKHQHYLF